ncbi:MAG: hypothetical protein ING75_13655 [Rhodocyclaceae bacterium]|nr:hypothetical protein [Rhodocyclaceae bacterium]
MAKRHSVHQLLRWALVHAIDDRVSFLASIGDDEPLKRDTQAQIAAFRSYLAKNTTLRPRGYYMRLACVFAESDRHALIHGQKGK